MICNCEICRNRPERVGFKKWRKWNARYVKRLKRSIKRLKDFGVKTHGAIHEETPEGELAALEWTLTETMLQAGEIRHAKNN